MTKAEYNAIRCAIYNCVSREQRLAAEYITLNPQDKVRRENDMMLVILGIRNLEAEIKKHVKID